MMSKRKTGANLAEEPPSKRRRMEAAGGGGLVHSAEEAEVEAEKKQEAARPKTRVVHCKRVPHYDVYIGRYNTSVRGGTTPQWGNPFRVYREADRAEAIRRYREWLLARPALVERARAELRGKVLACWCSPKACHGDVLAEVADQDAIHSPRPGPGQSSTYPHMSISRRGEETETEVEVEVEAEAGGESTSRGKESECVAGSRQRG